MLRRQLTSPGLMHVCCNGNFLCQGSVRGQRCVAEVIGELRLADSARYRGHVMRCGCSPESSYWKLVIHHAQREKRIEHFSEIVCGLIL
jgi:hypothetical protein